MGVLLGEGTHYSSTSPDHGQAFSSLARAWYRGSALLGGKAGRCGSERRLRWRGDGLPGGSPERTSPSGSSRSGAKGHREVKDLLPMAGAGDSQVEARFVFCLSRGLETRLLARIDRADYVKVGLRRINLPQPRQLGDGPWMMVDAQIDVGKCLPVHDEEPRSCHRLVLSAGSLAGLERIDEATRQRLVGGPLKRRHHRA